MSPYSPSTWNFDIDRYLNRLVPAPRWHLIPSAAARFLGHRKSKPSDLGNIAKISWAVIGVFTAICFIELAFRSIPAVEQSGLIIVTSFGAAAVLEFYAIESPLAQPRNAILGQLIAATIGICISKLFALSPEYASNRWIGGGLSCALATAVMALTKTAHPPAGATALLAVVDEVAVGLGWTLLPVILLGCAIMLGTALLVNNMQRRFPLYWWTPENLARRAPGMIEEKHDLEHGDAIVTEYEGDDASIEIRIQRGAVAVPSHINLSSEEKLVLESISNRL